MLAFTDNDHWTPGIGDPTLVGWLTVVAYFAAAWLCWSAGRAARGPSPVQRRAHYFWTAFAVVLVLLGFNKQLDLQTWFTLFAKHLALNEGWYRERRPVQAAFIGLVAIAGAVSLTGLGLLARGATCAVRTALMGGIFLGCFILIRASSFHHVDQMLGMDFGGVKVNWILELGGISFIGAAAARALRAPLPAQAGAPDFVWVSAGDRLKKPGV